MDGKVGPDLKGSTGPAGPPGAVPTAGSFEIVGPGRPDQPATTGGLITGSEPIGCYYRNSKAGADACGARRWEKIAASTWTVVTGDTGWRDVTPSPLPATITSGRILVKRIGDTVVKEDRPEIRGMIRTVTHLVTFEEVE